MNTGSRRTQKVASLLQSVLARLVIEEVSDPRLKEVTVTDVTLTGDLREATIYFACGSANLKEINQGLKRATPFFRRRLGEEVDLRHVPDLQFTLDKHGDNLNRLLKVFDDVAHAEKTGSQHS
jgi:ribosome-binding factor A